MNRKWMIIDVSFVAHRAAFTAGTGYEGLKGMIVQVAYLTRSMKPDALAFCFDSSCGWRKEICPTYKQSRKNEGQEKNEIFQLIDDFKATLEQYGLDTVFKVDGCEGDDLIAACARNMTLSEEYCTGTIITADEDMLQLLHDRIECYNPVSRKLTTKASFIAHHKIHPKHWRTVKAICGCKSDEVPGVVGVGTKTAIKYLHSLLPMTSKQYKAIESAHELIEKNLQVVTLPSPKTPPINLKNMNGKMCLQKCSELHRDLFGSHRMLWSMSCVK